MPKAILFLFLGMLSLSQANAWQTALDDVPETVSMNINEPQSCISKTIHFTCDNVEATKRLNLAQKNHLYKKVALQSRTIDADEGKEYGCKTTQQNAYFVTAIICE